MPVERWSDEKRETLRRLIEAGRTYSEIGAEMGVTRSAVAGQVLRMGLRSANPWGSLPKDGRPAGSKRPRSRRLSMPVVHAAAPAEAPEPVTPPVVLPVFIPPQPPKPRGPVTLIDAEFGQCRWITKRDPQRRGGDIVCAEPVVGDKSWCAEHHAICFSRAPQRTRAQLEADERRGRAMLRKSGAARAFA